MKKQGTVLADENLQILSDAGLSESISKRSAIFEKWTDVYWSEFIPFAHGMRLFGQLYNDLMKPDDPYEFMELLGAAQLESLQRNKMLEDLGMTCIFSAEWDSAFDYFNKLLGMARAAKDNVQISRYLQKLGFIHQERSEFDQALNYYENALEAAEDSKDAGSIGESCELIGRIYWYKGNYII